MRKDDLSDQMWFTYKARFNANARLLLQANIYSIITAVLSIFIIIVNIILIIPDYFTINYAITASYTISLSIIILVISIVFASSNKKREAEKFHTCALEVQKLYREYIAENDDLKNEVIKKYSNKYSEVLSKYDINHSTSDYEKVKVITSGNIINKICHYIFRFFIYYSLLIFLLILPILFGVIIIFIN